MPKRAPPCSSITPFGSTTPWPVIADASIDPNEVVAIGGGAHGVNLHIGVAALLQRLDATVADVTDAGSPSD